MKPTTPNTSALEAMLPTDEEIFAHYRSTNNSNNAQKKMASGAIYMRYIAEKLLAERDKKLASVESELGVCKEKLKIAMSYVDCDDECYGYKCSTRCRVTIMEKSISALEQTR